MQTNPVLVHVTRGDLVESRHRGSCAVVDTAGRIVARVGDIDAPIFARSAIKLLQAIAVVETGAAAAFQLPQAALAIACGSHGGEPRHVAVVQEVLARIGLQSGDLDCGAHLPGNAAAAAALIRAGGAPSALHNNCSGKHAAMLAVCRHLGEATRGYIAPDHPHQRRIAAVLEAMLGVSLAGTARGIDGCGLPQIGLPLAALARGIARFGAPDDLAGARAAACRALAAAIVAEPFMLAGTQRYCTRVIAAGAGAVLVKTGAEGVHVGAIPALGLGIAVKIDDGAARAAEVVMSHLLLQYAPLPADARLLLEQLRAPAVTNVAGREVGRILMAGDD